MHLCANCSASASLKCSRCRSVYYCSVKCQKEHWKKHKYECANMNIDSLPIEKSGFKAKNKVIGSSTLNETESSIDITYIVSQQTTNKDIHIQFEPDSVHIRIEKPISIDQTLTLPSIINKYESLWTLQNDLLIIHCVKQRNSQQPSDYLLQTSTSSKQWKQYKSTEDHTKICKGQYLTEYYTRTSTCILILPHSQCPLNFHVYSYDALRKILVIEYLDDIQHTNYFDSFQYICIYGQFNCHQIQYTYENQCFYIHLLLNPITCDLYPINDLHECMELLTTFNSIRRSLTESMTCSCSTCQHPLLSIDLQHIQKCHNRYISEYNYLMEDICCEHTQEYMKDTVENQFEISPQDCYYYPYSFLLSLSYTHLNMTHLKLLSIPSSYTNVHFLSTLITMNMSLGLSSLILCKECSSLCGLLYYDTTDLKSQYVEFFYNHHHWSTTPPSKLQMPEINTFHYRFLKSLLVHGKNKNIFNVFLYKGIESAELSTLQPSFYLCIDNYNIYYTQNTLQLKKGIKCHSSTEFTTNPTEPILRYYMTTRDYQQLLHYLNENQCPSSSYYYLEINKNV